MIYSVPVSSIILVDLVLRNTSPLFFILRFAQFA